MPELVPVVGLSLQVALLATLLCVPPAFALAWVFARKRFFGRSLVELLVHAPLVVPPVVTGYALLALVSPGGPLSFLAPWLAFSWLGAALAAALVALPLAVRTARVAFESVPPELEEAAASLGASPWVCWRKVTLPAAAPGLVAAALIAFARALGEFGATITFAGNMVGESRTLPLAIWTELQTPGGESRAGVYVVASLLLALGALAASEFFVRRLSR